MTLIVSVAVFVVVLVARIVLTPRRRGLSGVRGKVKLIHLLAVALLAWLTIGRNLVSVGDSLDRIPVAEGRP